MRKILIFVTLILSGCASVAPHRVELTNIPPLEKGWGRIFISGTQYAKYGLTIAGSVYINGQKVDSIAYKEHIAIDLLPGSYEANWVQKVPDNTYSEKMEITLREGEIRYFTGYINSTAAGFIVGLASPLLHASNSERLPSLYSGRLNEDALGFVDSRLVSYVKFDGSSNSN